MRALADELRQDYSRRGIHLEEVAGGLVFRTSAAYAPFIRDVTAKKPVRMTRAQLETLAIIAYRQPLTRPEVDDIRGVDSGPGAEDACSIAISSGSSARRTSPGGRSSTARRPSFLEFFGLKSLKDLP